ncbi:hypothetical protein B0F90DRAFT_1747678 [Multifurca ochricompacta]|uniref:Secreted protein n=1 Tax=Multifurca ochricompacta TaxID=376703 RepID=A0AAD4LZ06_9AGAM|nr:hypothetical protein B0F90DRAFT_1747678 [Multifurca ochricompacta]
MPFGFWKSCWYCFCFFSFLGVRNGDKDSIFEGKERCIRNCRKQKKEAPLPCLQGFYERSRGIQIPFTFLKIIYPFHMPLIGSRTMSVAHIP